MNDGQGAYKPHGLAETGFDDPVAHADDQEQEKAERITASRKDRDYYHEGFRAAVHPMSVLKVVKEPRHEYFDDKENENRRDIILDRQDIGSMLVIQKCPSAGHQSIN